MTGLNCGRILEKARARGIQESVLATLEHAGIDMERWLRGFESVEAGVRASVQVIRNHPLLPGDVPVHGLLIDSETGKLELIVDGAKR
jgi:carbonic anhydrase